MAELGLRDAVLRGTHDDGTTDGIVRTKLDQGPMDLFLPRNGQYINVSNNGSASISSSAANEFAERGAPGRILLTTGTATTASEGQPDAGLLVPIPGRRIGLVLLETSAFSGVKVDAFIDGDHVLRTDTTSRTGRYDTTATNVGPAWNGITHLTLADDLPDDAPHAVEVWARTPDSGFSQVHILGFLVESRLGLGKGQPIETVLPPVALTTSYAQVPFTAYASVPQATAYMRGVRRLDYVNTDTVAHTVLVQITANGTAAVFRTVTVPAASGGLAGTASLDFGRPVGVDSGWAQKLGEAISSGAVNCFATGAW